LPKLESLLKINKTTIKNLIDQLSIETPDMLLDGEGIKSPFFGKTIVFSGTFKTFKKKEAGDIALKLGAQVSDNVTKNVDYFIYGKGSGLKLEKAKKYNLIILTEDEWLEMIGDKVQ